jgi:hypothetical protein
VSVTERQRLELFERLGETLGPSAAEVLMEYLPPIGWSDVSRRADIEALRADLAGLQAEFHREQSRLLLALLTSQFMLAVVIVPTQAFS